MKVILLSIGILNIACHLKKLIQINKMLKTDEDFFLICL